ncbi:hypothetical protein M406DRAFT_59980 [Cryphonectria parasitica EP155]|uniref:NADP-dependent oxidoreductase domain-containing protein n=1 Tax=Cryphonectria parasitica (strain ATCC 38755 / EP155) TaxID=660469 RepID=A0A9P5CUE7_CRYP1|nr:uncharacterized protein M406DRAFT_59980 [Cryphonectria parasitica EP155]KAF3771273.1 hypothetical protein M406DRAFT_59980 [Cryphonectria parasitica EP155]
MASQITIAGKAVGPLTPLAGLTFPWKKLDLPAAAKVMKASLEHGANFWNGGLFYGSPDHNSLHLLKYYFSQYPEDADKVVLSIKGAYDMSTFTPTGSPEAIRAAVDTALRVLDGCKKIDVFQMGRVDPKVPIEESVGTLAALVSEGKIGGVGLSEVSEKTIRRAAKITEIAAVEIELSLFTTDPLTNGIVDACEELDIPIVAYSPVGRGFLTGQISRREDMDPTDARLRFPRFQPDVFSQNLKLVDAVKQIADRKGLPLAAVAIAWTKYQGKKILPLPGASKVEQVVQNCTDVQLSEEDLAEIRKILDALPVAGARYGGALEAQLNG